MKTHSKSGIAVKLFVGCLLTGEGKLNLRNSLGWKQAKISGQHHPLNLQEIHYQNHEYLGIFVSEEYLTLKELKVFEERIRKAIEDYCPDLDQNTLKVVVFPQILVS